VGNTSRPETIGKLLRGLLTATIVVNIEGEINRALVVAQLPKLAGVEVGAQRAGEVMKTCLPQHGIVELGARQKSMGKGIAQTAAVEVDNASGVTAGEDDATVESVAALRVDQANLAKKIETIALSGEMSAQASAGSIADPQLFDQCRIVQSASLKITQCLRVAIELLLIERGHLIKHCGRVDERSALLLEVGKTLAEREMAGQLDKTN
jgi:hypothetical protein